MGAQPVNTLSTITITPSDHHHHRRRKKKIDRSTMRSSCNGCQALRKACVDGCAIRPCLGWIGTPEAQANATVFLAKFYGRAGLLNLLAAAPDDAHRPALFRSLLYEACGRAANPVYGAAGLFSSGNWEACKDALLAVLHDRPIVQVDARLAVPHPGLVLAYDVRHVDAATKKKIDHAPPPTPVTDQLLGVSRAGRTAFKRASSSSSMVRPKSKHDGGVQESAGSLGHIEDGGVAMAGEQMTRRESSSSVSHVSQAEQSPPVPDDEIGLELTLGFGPATRVLRSPPACFGAGSSSGAESGHIGLMLGLPV